MKKPNTLLKVVSILCIVFGVIALIIVILGALGVGLMASVATTEDMAELGESGASALGGLAVASLAIAAIQAIVEVAAGIMGVKARNLKACRTLSFVFFFLALWNALMALIGSSVDIASIITYICGLILPILYFIGVKKKIDAR